MAKSPRASSDRELVRHDVTRGEDTYSRVAAQIEDDGQQLSVQIDFKSTLPNPQAGSDSEGQLSLGGVPQGRLTQKYIRVNGVPRKASDLVGQIKAVMFSADDLELVYGPPSVRRRYLDILISQLDRRYLRALQRYQRVIYQRNHPNNLDFVITMLPTGKEVKEVTIGNHGIVNYTKDNFIYIDMSTILPKDSIEISQQLKKKGISMLDAPVARLVQNAIDGTLLILVGGEKEEYDLSKSMLSCMGNDVVYCGTSGSGSKMKIINNYMSILLNIITAETLVLADSSGINRDLAIELMSTTAAGKGHMNLTYPAKVFKNDISPGFKNSLALKDLRLAIEHAKNEGLDLKTGKTVEKIYTNAIDLDYGNFDWTSMYKFIKENSNFD
mgnify:CR=1 FL=1